MTSPRVALPSVRGLSVPRPRRIHLVGGVLALALLFGGWLWLRDSSLVAINKVIVTGVSGPDAGRIRIALSDAAADMTTLHVRRDQLMKAVEPFPVVRDIEVSTDFPHGLRIHVVPHVAVAVVVADGRRIAVAGDGTLLRVATTTDGLATVAVPAVPGGTRLSDRRGLASVRLLAAAPAALRERAVRVTSGSHGLTVTLKAGPDLYFGDATRLRAKWAAASRVMADRTSAGATYIDVRVPERPVAGGVAPERQTQPPPPDPVQTTAQTQTQQQPQQEVAQTQQQPQTQQTQQVQGQSGATQDATGGIQANPQP